MMKILAALPNQALTEKNFLANIRCIQTATGCSNTDTHFFSVPPDIHNDPDLSGSFLFADRDKKYFSDPDQSIMHQQQVLYKNIIERKLFVNLNSEYEK